MLYDALFTLDLPTTVGPPLPTPFWDGLERWLFTGSWARRMASCQLSAAAVLAGAYAALRTTPTPPDFRLLNDASEVLDLSAVPDRWGVSPEPFAEVLPPRWTTEPCAFHLRASWMEGGFASVVRARFAPRHDVEQTAVSGSIRSLWVPDDIEAPLRTRLEAAADSDVLFRLLHTHGERVAEDTVAALKQQLGGQASFRGRVVVLAGDPSTFGDRLEGFPEAALQALPRITACLRGAWPALSEQGVEGRFTEGDFVAVAEVAHVV